MKILIVSDTHRQNSNFFEIAKKHNPDRIIHCGDAEGSEYALTNGVECPVDIVRGNNDYFSELPRELEVSVGGKKLWITHGHNYYVSMGNEKIMEEAKSRGVDIVCFGHTHKPEIEHGDGVIAINPGSLSYPRQEGRKPSYVIMEQDRFEQWHYTIAYVK